MANYRDFSDWESNFRDHLGDLSKGLKTGVKLVTSGNAPRTIDLPELLADFATTFVQDHFVNDMMRRAYFFGEGVPGATGLTSLEARIPRIDKGVSMNSKTGTHTVTFDWNRALSRSDRVTEAYAQKIADANAHAHKTGDVSRLRLVLAAEERAQQRAAYFKNLDNNININDVGGLNKMQHEFDDHNNEEDIAPETIKGRWATGFDKLWQGISRVTTPRIGPKGISIGIGDGHEIMQPKLSDYSVVQGEGGTSEYNSFFYAAEYGTGIAENVGASFVREQKKGGAEKLGPFRGPPGSWWFWAKNDGGGALFTGQRGAHMFFDPNNRNVRPEYGKWMKENLPRLLDIYLRQKTGNRIKRAQ